MSARFIDLGCNTHLFFIRVGIRPNTFFVSYGEIKGLICPSSWKKDRLHKSTKDIKALESGEREISIKEMEKLAFPPAPRYGLL
jgi:hypothetical protein